MLFLEMTASAPRLAAMLGHDPSPRIDGAVETAVEHADAALYAAKRNGRDCVVVYTP